MVVVKGEIINNQESTNDDDNNEDIPVRMDIGELLCVPPPSHSPSPPSLSLIEEILDVGFSCMRKNICVNRQLPSSCRGTR